jgi:hypothetical protein
MLLKMILDGSLAIILGLIPLLFSQVLSADDYYIRCCTAEAVRSSIRRERLDSVISRRLIIIRNIKDKKKKATAQLNQLGFCS